MNFIQTSVSTFIGQNDANWQGALVTTVVGVTDTGLVYETSRMDNGLWSEWELVGPEIANAVELDRS